MDVVNIIENCMLPSLSKPYDEVLDHSEFKLYQQTISKNLETLLSYLSKSELTVNLTAIGKNDLYSRLIILMEELNSNGPWRVQNLQSFVSSLKMWMTNNEESDFYVLLSNTFGSSETIYISCLRKLHMKLTRENWKYHPSAVSCYHNIVKHLENHCVEQCPLELTIPASLLLMDDYHTENKIIGLECCTILIKFNIQHNVDISNYEKVVYNILLKHLRFKDNEVFNQTVECLKVLLPCLNSTNSGHSSKWTEIDDVIQIVMDDLYLDSDLIKKQLLLKCLKESFIVNGVTAIRWTKKFIDVLVEIFEGFLNKRHRELLLFDSIDCFLEWLKYSWMLITYAKIKRTFQTLLKVLFVLSSEDINEDIQAQKITDFLHILYHVCLMNNDNCLQEKLNNGLKHFKCNSKYLRHLQYIQSL